MKSLKSIFSVGLLGVCMLIFSHSFSQSNPGDLIYKSAMAEIVNQGKQYYKKGMSLDSFVQETGYTVRQLSNAELAVTTEVYNYLKNGNSSASIMDSYNGENLKKVANTNAFEWAPQTSGKGCKFWCWFKRIVDILIIIAGW